LSSLSRAFDVTGHRRRLRALLPMIVLLTVAGIGAALALVSDIDLSVASWYYLPTHTDAMNNFLMRRNALAGGIHEAVQVGARWLALGLVGGFLYTAIRLTRLFGWSSRHWLFLVLALALGPGLIVNGVLKETWGRARPSQLAMFGQERAFSSALVPSDQCEHNCSFPCGDAALAFYVHSFACLPGRRRRLVFWGGLGFGLAIGWVRIMMGGHFLSDVYFAGLITLASTAAAQALVFGQAAVRRFWSDVVLA